MCECDFLYNLPLSDYINEFDINKFGIDNEVLISQIEFINKGMDVISDVSLSNSWIHKNKMCVNMAYHILCGKNTEYTSGCEEDLDGIIFGCGLNSVIAICFVVGKDFFK